MAELRAEGKALFVTSHVLSDLESFCDEVVILRKGVAVAQGHLDDLLRRDRLESSATLTLPAGASAALGAELAAACGGSVTAEKDGKVTVLLPSDAVAALTAAAAERSATLVELHPVKDTLEELFVRQALAIEGAGSQEAP